MAAGGRAGAWAGARCFVVQRIGLSRGVGVRARASGVDRVRIGQRTGAPLVPSSVAIGIGDLVLVIWREFECIYVRA